MTNDSHDRRHGSCGSGARRRGRDGGRGRRREGEDRDGPGRRRGSRRERKEKVLHTRISEQLAEDIRRFAEEVRVPASNLVRNVLEEVFTVADSIQDDVGDLMDDLAAEAEGVRDRVWRQQRRRARARREREADADVEAEFRRDEAAEAEDVREEAEPEASAESEAEETPPIPPASQLFPDVLGWQPLVLNRDMACGRCALELRAGESAFLGMAAGGLTETALCGPCASGSTGRRGR